MIADLIASSTLSNSVENPNLSNSEITRQVTPFWDQLASFVFLMLFMHIIKEELERDVPPV